MDLFHVAIVVIIIGVLLWVANEYIPMASSIKKILNIVVPVGLVIWLINLFVNIPHIPFIK